MLVRKSNSTMSYIYKSVPLDASNDEIRLITVLSGIRNQGVLQCMMETVTLQDQTRDYHRFFSRSPTVEQGKLLSFW